METLENIRTKYRDDILMLAEKYGVEDDTIWNVIENKIPTLKDWC